MATANVYDGSAFQEMVDDVADEMVVFSDEHFKKKDWFPTNLKVCPRGTWNDRMIVETVLSMLTVVCHFKKVGHRAWRYIQEPGRLYDGFIQYSGAMAWATA